MFDGISLSARILGPSFERSTAFVAHGARRVEAVKEGMEIRNTPFA
jgi:hypothetical protein